MFKERLAQDIAQLEIVQVYDHFYAGESIYYETLDNLANFFGRAMPPHRHEQFYQLHYIESGSVALKLGTQNYQLEAPLFFYTPPSVPHGFTTQQQAKGHVLTLAVEVVNRYMLACGEEAARPFLNQAACVMLEDNAAENYANEQLLRAFRGLQTSAQEALSPALLAEKMHWVYLILHHVFARIDSTPPCHADYAPQAVVLQRFLALAEKHYTEHWTIAHYAAALGVSYKKLNHICQKYTDKPAKRLIIERLVKEARYLLTQTSNTVAQISDLLGFTDPPYFSRFFQREMHVRPRVYREQRLTTSLAD